MATELELKAVAALVATQAQQRALLTRAAQRRVASAWRDVNDFWDPTQTGRAVQTSVSAVQGAQRRVATLTDAYLARVSSISSRRRIAPVGAVDIRSLRRQLPPAVIETLAHAETSSHGAGPTLSAGEQRAITRASTKVTGVDLTDVYGRIADGVRYQMTANARSFAQASREAVNRAEAMADTDVSLAHRAQAHSFMTERSGKGIKGYRRVLRPEIDAGGGAGQPPCGLCVVAADRLYFIEELMPIHARCRCAVVAVFEGSDWGARMNSDDLTAIYQAAGATGGGKRQGGALKRIRVDVVEHGELGPILTNAEHAFRGPREVAKTQTKDPNLRYIDQLDARLQTLDVLIGRQAAGEDVDRAIAWNKSKIKELNARIPA